MKEMDTLECSSVCVTATEITEKDNEKVLISIPKEQIERITLKHGLKANRPFIEMCIGIGLIALGYFTGILPIKSFLIKIINEPEVNIRPTLYTIFMALIWTPLGVYLTIDALKRRYYLLIETVSGKKKAVFKDDLTKSEVITFINNIRDKYRYNIKSDLY